MKKVIPFITLVILSSVSVQAAPISVTYTINTDTGGTPISKYVYGSNDGSSTDNTIRRSGGNRLTAYNWENNWSNAGADWWWENDQGMSSSSIPGKAITDFHDGAISRGQASIVTLQMAGYVSDSVFGMVDCNLYAAPSFYFKKVAFAKGTPFCNPAGSPDVCDANVYMDEFVNFLVSKYGHAGEPNGVKFYDLDNEPALWYQNSPPRNATHWEVHPYRPTCVEYRDKSIDLSKAVKVVDPNAQICGPVSYGFNEYYNFQGASDWGSQGAGYNWFLSYYLDKMKGASVTAGKRLLDVLDIHLYSAACDSTGIDIYKTINTTAMYNARMQAPRSLWDYDYHENSWVEQQHGSFLPILPVLKSSINTYYQDTNLGTSEYGWGGENHYSGGIATVDSLGIYGKYGLYFATYWGNGSYVRAAFQLYRNYNGWQFTYGDTNIPANMSDKANSSIYGSIFGTDTNELHLIVINKNIDNPINGTFNITSTKNYTIGRVWAFDSNSAGIAPLAGTIAVTGNSFTYSIPSKTACHIVLWQGCPYQSDLNGDCRADYTDLEILCNQWLTDCSADPDCADYDNNLIVDFADLAFMSQEWRM